MSTAAPTAHHETTEKPGLLIGASNTLTQEKKTLPLTVLPAEDFETDHEEAMRLLTGFHAHFDDRVLAGLCVRLCTNSPHLSDFWRRTTWSPGEWKTITGRDVDPAPALTVTAVIDGSGAEPTAVSDPLSPRIILRNTSHYGTLRRIILDRACALLADQGVLSLAATAVKGSSGLLLMTGKSGAGKTTLATLANAETMADHRVAIRFGRPTRNGRPFLFANPSQIDTDFETAEGTDPEGAPRTVRPADFESDAPVSVWAAPIERRTSLATSMLRFHPPLLPDLLMARMENVPDRAEGADGALDAAVAAAHPDGCPHFLGHLDAEATRAAVSRLLASEDAVAIPDRPVCDPFWRPVTGVAVVSREGDSGRIVPLPKEALASRLDPAVDAPGQRALIERLAGLLEASELINGKGEPARAAAVLGKIPGA